MNVKFYSEDDMTKREKLNWIVKYITENGWQDIFMEEFVDSYIYQSASLRK